MKKEKSTQADPATGAASIGSNNSDDQTSSETSKASSKVWSGMLMFGLISMPISLRTAATEERVSFNQIHPQCQGRIKQQLFCPTCNEVVTKNDLVKGYEHEKGQYVIVTQAELTAVEPKSAKTLELSAFVPASQLDPILFESSYYLTPGEGGEKPYSLVLQAMRESSLVGVARIVRNGREHVCVIRPFGGGMVLHTLYWIDEVRAISFPELPAPNEAEVGVAKTVNSNAHGRVGPQTVQRRLPRGGHGTDRFKARRQRGNRTGSIRSESGSYRHHSGATGVARCSKGAKRSRLVDAPRAADSHRVSPGGALHRR